MKKLITIFLLITTLFWGERLNAQQDPMFSQYMFNTMSINPAYAGSADLISSTLISRHQWIGLKGAPQTQTFVIHSPLTKQIGAGISAIRDIVGPSRNISIQANSSYFVQVNEVSRLYFGLMAGINTLNTSLTEVGGVNIDDISFHQDLNSIRPVFGFGIYFRTPKAYAGISLPDLAKTNYSGINTDWQHKRHFYFIGGYLFEISESIKFRPTIMLRYVNDSPLSAEFTGSAIFNDLLWIGFLYRFQDAAGAVFSFQINKELRIGYSYDYSLNLLRGHQGGSHEIMLNYDFGFKQATYSSPRYF